VKEARYNPQRPPEDPRDGPATYRHMPARLTLSSDRWTPVDEATAEALRAVPGMEIREAGDDTGVHPREAPGAAGGSEPDASGGSTPAPGAAPAPQPEEEPGPAALTAGRRGRRRGGADG
jgi:hypothetical protein